MAAWPERADPRALRESDDLTNYSVERVRGFDNKASQMTDGISQNAASPQTAEHRAPRKERRQHLLPCVQCSEHYARVTVFCPRCHRWNHRSPLAITLRVLTVTIFIATVAWTVWFISKVENSPKTDDTVNAPQPTAEVPSLHDVRF